MVQNEHTPSDKPQTVLGTLATPSQTPEDQTPSSAVTPHGFDPEIAVSHGIPAALIYGYIQWRCQHSKVEWVQLTLENVAVQYPYLGKKQVWSALKKLTDKKSGLLTKKPSLYGYANRYQLKGKPKSCQRPHKFDASLAAEHGIIPAVIHWNISHWIKKNWRQLTEELERQLKPEDYDDNLTLMMETALDQTRDAAKFKGGAEQWAKLHPYTSLSTVERGFATLLKAGLLKKYRTSDRVPVWFLPKKELDAYAAKFMEKSGLKNSSFKRKSSTSKGKSEPQKETVSFKKDEVIDVTHSEGMKSEVLNEAVVDEAVCLMKPLKEDDDAFRSSPPLADARGGLAGTASNAAAPLTPSASAPECKPAGIRKTKRRLKLDIRQKLQVLKTPAVAKVEKKLQRDSFGNIATRAYTRKPKPNDPDYAVYLDSLPEAERRQYEARFLSVTASGSAD